MEVYPMKKHLATAVLIFGGLANPGFADNFAVCSAKDAGAIFEKLDMVEAFARSSPG